MFDWYADLSRVERSTFWACYGGWMLDALDAQMFALVIPAIMGTWHISPSAAGSVAGITLAASACGGWMAGSLADRYGRVKILQMTVACFSVFSLLAALSQNQTQLLACKALQGLGFGGEWAVGTVLLAEIVPVAHRGKALGSVQSGWAVGWAGSVLLYTGLSLLLPPDISWRVLFGLGALPALLLLYIQRALREPPRTTAVLAMQKQFSAKDMFQIFSPAAIRGTLIGALLGIGAHGGYYALTTWLPTYLMVERHVSVLNTGGYLSVIIVSFWCGCVATSYLLDRLGRRQTILAFALCCATMIGLYLLVPISNGVMLWLGAPLGFFSAGIPASMGTLFSELFPSGMRGTGVGFCYNFGRVVAAFLPALVGMLSGVISLNLAIGATAISAYLLVAVAVLALPETRQRLLQS